MNKGSDDYICSVRVRCMDEGQKVYARSHAFTVGEQANFGGTDTHASAVEYLLGALGGDLVRGVQAQATRSRIRIDAMELSLSGRLNNALTHLGVIGEEGHPGFESIEGTLYMNSSADEEVIQRIWNTALQRSPLVNTLRRCVQLSLTVSVL